jgi:hypothetical protein
LALVNEGLRKSVRDRRPDGCAKLTELGFRVTLVQEDALISERTPGHAQPDNVGAPARLVP